MLIIKNFHFKIILQIIAMRNKKAVQIIFLKKQVTQQWHALSRTHLFIKIHFSPLLVRPKPNGKYRVIVDFSWPQPQLRSWYVWAFRWMQKQEYGLFHMNNCKKKIKNYVYNGRMKLLPLEINCKKLLSEYMYKTSQIVR